MGEVVEREVGGPLPVDGQHQVGQRVLDVGVAAVLGDQHVGRHSRSSGGTTAWKARSQPASEVPGGSATLTAEPFASGPPESWREAGAGEQHLAGLVERDGEHPRVVPEDPLDAVAVVDVDVDVRDPLGALVEQVLDADRDVVVDAEAAGPVGHPVVEAAGDVGAVEAARRVHTWSHASMVAPTTCAVAVVHVAEDRVVVAAEAAALVVVAVGARPGPRRRSAPGRGR